MSDQQLDDEIRPKRTGSHKLEFGDQPIMIAGCEIGKLVSSKTMFNWMLPITWMGSGMPIFQATVKTLGIRGKSIETSKVIDSQPKSLKRRELFTATQPGTNDNRKVMEEFQKIFTFLKRLPEQKIVKVGVSNSKAVMIIRLAKEEEIKQTIALLKSCEIG